MIHADGFDPNQTIAVFGSVRSGSTWLAELLSSLDGHLQLFEPLHPKYVPEAARILQTRNTYVPVGAPWPEGRKFFSEILSGRLINSWILSQASVSRVFRTRRLVAKFVRGNLLLDWLTTNYGLRNAVLVIRHPCAVVASQLTKGWRPGKTTLLANPYFERHPEIQERCAPLTRPEEIAALAWCLRYHAPLMSEKPYRFTLVTYEALVRNGVSELERLFQALGIPFDSAVIEKLSRPSDTATETSPIVSGKDPLGGWQHRLTNRQVNNILSVLNIFGMNFYSAEPEPEYSRLRAFGPPTTRVR